jgi:PIN domain nuclease of toxin-antitoxin system
VERKVNVVLDTCALLWLTLDPSELSPKAHKAISNAEQILVSSISIWEIGIKFQRKKIELGTSYVDYVDRVSSAAQIELVPIDHRQWVNSIKLDWNHKDPADRVIVSLASTLELQLITDDEQIRQFYKKTIS